MLYGNTPITNLVEWEVPAPLDKIVEACTRVLPADRPSLDEIRNMTEILKISYSISDLGLSSRFIDFWALLSCYY
ncbi:putative serine threonine protein kinase [Rosellinia necatrix]|uniref:Putative serine threonine protein kinase n=1 Tax=Rosellinia necatrix TaxID=77044 RepID=A0A1S8A6D3_ROSNE|nr:putative serine threonine protein kinase [Rosellinia necatrix]